MLMDILATTMGVLGMAGGISALVLYRKQNGNGYRAEPPAPPPPVQQGAEDRQLAKLAEAIAPLAQLPKQLEARLELVVERLANTMEAYAAQPLDLPEPSWPADLASRLEALEAARAARLETLAQDIATLGANPPVVQIPEIQAQMPPEVTRQIENLIAHISRLLQPMMRTQPPEPLFTPRGPATRAPLPVQLDLFNTVVLQDNELVELVPPEQHMYVMSVFNLGAGICYMKARDDLYIDDPLATTIPAGSGDNGVHCPVSLFVIAEDGCKLSIRLNQ